MLTTLISTPTGGGSSNQSSAAPRTPTQASYRNGSHEFSTLTSPAYDRFSVAPYPDIFSQALIQLIGRYRTKISDLTALTEEFEHALHAPATPKRGVSTIIPHGSSHLRPEVLAPLCQHTPASPRLSLGGDEDVSETSSAKSFKTSHVRLYETQFDVKQGWAVTALGAASSANLELSTRSAASVKSSKSSVTAVSEDGFDTSKSFASVENDTVFSRWLVSSPSNPKHISWEIFGLVLVLYDLIAIPLLFIFDPPTNAFVDAMDWIERVFWTFNIPVTLTTGFIDKGVLVMGLQRIFLRYLRTWCMVDVITVIPDWLFLLLSLFGDEDDESSDKPFLRMLRFLRLLRMARLMRMVKLRNAWELIHDFIDSEKVSIVLEVLKNMLILMLANHYIASLWFAIGSAQTGKSWVKQHGFTDAAVDWGHQYLVAYHWGLTQFTSTMHVQPHNVIERAFAICVVIFGLVGFSYIVGSISSSLARLRAMDEDRTTKFWILRKFLNQQKVPHELSVRIRAYVQCRWEYSQTHLVASNIESLALLSEHLKSELYCALHVPSLRIHPLFEELHVHSRVTTQRLMLTGIAQLSLAPDDMLFIAGEEAKQMSFLTSGTMQYDRMHLEQSYPEVVECHEDWIAEPVLWVSEWCHLGDLRSKTSADLLLVDPESLQSIARLNPLAFALLCSYSQSYVLWLNSKQRRELLSDISQGEIISDELGDMVNEILFSMSLKAKRPPSTSPRVSVHSNARRLSNRSNSTQGSSHRFSR